ncbi:hypothetical protein Mapa_000606 [Marchantia paleacea]|nr:hypothetical protein Mapa_000606 [Marchantia paleacea]
MISGRVDILWVSLALLASPNDRIAVSRQTSSLFPLQFIPFEKPFPVYYKQTSSYPLNQHMHFYSFHGSNHCLTLRTYEQLICEIVQSLQSFYFIHAFRPLPDRQGLPAQSAEKTKNLGTEKTGQTQDSGHEVGQAPEDKSHQARQASSDATQTAEDKAVEGKDNASKRLGAGW